MIRGVWQVIRNCPTYSPISSWATTKSDLSSSHFFLLLCQINSCIFVSAEVFVDEPLSHRPDVYLFALTQFANFLDTVEVEVVSPSAARLVRLSWKIVPDVLRLAHTPPLSRRPCEDL